MRGRSPASVSLRANQARSQRLIAELQDQVAEAQETLRESRALLAAGRKRTREGTS